MEQETTVNTPGHSATDIAKNETNNDKTMAIFAHAGGIFFGFVPALIIWLVKKDESAYVAAQAKEA